MVELSGSAGRAPAARRNRASILDRRGRPRGAARAPGEPRVGNRRPRAHRCPRSGWQTFITACERSCASIQRTAPMRTFARVPVLVVVAVAALVCSLSPERTIGAFTFVRPSALLYSVVPMFRAYARFGVVVQLMAALLAGIGVDWLRPRRHQAVRGSCASRSWPWRLASTRSRRRRCGATCFPTTAHRWVAATGRCRAGPRLHAARSGIRISSVADGLSRDVAGRLDQRLHRCRTCPGSLRRMATRICSCGGTPPRDSCSPITLPPDGLRVAARFDDGQVFAVTARTAGDLYGNDDRVLSPRAGSRSGRGDGWERTRRGRSRTPAAGRSSPPSALKCRRSIIRAASSLLLDGRHVQTLVVEPSRRVYQLGPIAVMPGDHELVFHPAEEPTVAGDVINNDDRRPLSFALGTWNWTVRGDQP